MTSTRSPQDTAQYWIDTLKLYPHPGLETGYLNVVFEDEHKVKGARTTGKEEERNAASNIYFLHQPAPPFSEDTVFFRMVNNELLNFYRGHSVTLYIFPEGDDHKKTTEPEKVVLGPDASRGQHYFYCIPRNRWFVRRLESDDPEDFALIGCTVVPGYHDDDIETKTMGQIRKL